MRPYLLMLMGFGIAAYSVLGTMEHGFSIAERGNPEQLEGGLYPLLLLIGLAIVVYGGIERWLNRK